MTFSGMELRSVSSPGSIVSMLWDVQQRPLNRPMAIWLISATCTFFGVTMRREASHSWRLDPGAGGSAYM